MDMNKITRQLWHNIKKRCYDPKHYGYPWYGARGISMLPEWKEDFAKFSAYIAEILGPKPAPTSTLDRIDNDKGYFPGNLRWATPKKQTFNQTYSIEKNVSDINYEALHSYMKRKRLSFVNIAHMIDYGEPHVRNVCTGKSRPSVKFKRALERAIDIPDLFFDD